ncbi:MAG: YqeG family HAD IIIA-type phosphatase [Armatimonadetes bacterium]|nr:YqeG family HAD IIIA-type phosphatase [Armatimonadota bacterium]
MCPDQAVHSLSDILPATVAESGYKLILLDVDNTLVPWREEVFPEETVAWINEIKAKGIQLCIISNTKHPDRLTRLSEILGVPFVRGKFKPSTEMFKQAMSKYAASPSETLMIGDQIFTDILGANRSGIETIWVRPLHKNEFFGTRYLSRNAEKLVRTGIYSVLEEDDDLPIVPHTGLFQRRVVRQFLKFCIVGGSSFVIDYSIRSGLMKYTTWHGEKMSVALGRSLIDRFPILFSHVTEPAKASFYLAALVAGIIAMANSFYWNRKWTFGIHGQAERSEQIKRFFVLSVCVLILNALVSGTLNNIIPGPRSQLFATLIATGIGAVCNFIGQRLWAFRKVTL